MNIHFIHVYNIFYIQSVILEYIPVKILHRILQKETRQFLHTDSTILKK